MLPLLLAAGALRITDSSRAGSNALRNAALEFSISCNTDIRIDRMPAKQSMMIIPQKTVDIAVLEEKDIPEELKNSPKILLGAEVLLIYVNRANPLADLPQKKAAEIFSAERPRWSELGGLNRAIHRFNLKTTAEHAGLDRELFKSFAAKEVVGLSHADDVVKMVSSDPESMGFAHFSTANDNAKILSVDGVYPDRKNIFNGRYPLAKKYFLVVVKPSDAAEKFVGFLKKDLASKVRKDMWILPEENASRQTFEHNRKLNFMKEK